MKGMSLPRLGLYLLLPLAACGSGGAHDEDHTGVDATDADDADADGARDALDDTDASDSSVDGSGEHSAELRRVECASLRALSAFDVGWAHMNHRISRLAVGLDRGQSIASDAPSAGTDAEGSGATVTDARVLALAEPPVCAANTWVATFVGGDFTTGAVAEDSAEIAVASTAVPLGPGARAWVVEIPTTVGPTGEVTGSVDLASIGIQADVGQNVVAFVQGFAFDTGVEQTADYGGDYDPALGYTSRGFGAGVQVRDGQTHLDWRLRFENGIGFDALFRPDMNAAIAHAQVGATLEVGVLVLDRTVPVFRAQVGWLQQTETPYRSTDAREPDVDAALRTVGFTGVTGGVGLIGAFDMRLYPDPACAGDRDCDTGDVCVDGTCAYRTGLPGDYVRQLSAGVESVSAGSDGVEVRVRGYASTASETFAFRPLRHEFEAQVVWVGVETGARSTGSVTGPAGTHRIEVAP